MITIQGIKGLRALVGQDLGASEWLTVDQDMINAFADATGDHDWLHVDVERAASTTFGKTISHGLFTLSLQSKFNEEIYAIEDIDYSLIYGFEKIRLPAPVPVDSELRMRTILQKIVDVPAGVRCTFTNMFEIKGSNKPACVAEFVLHVVGKE